MAVETIGYQVDVLLDRGAWRAALAAGVRAGLTAGRKSLPATLFHDPVALALLERITELPEYYLTRAERALLAVHARELVGMVQPRDLVELGAGSGRTIRHLLDGLEPGDGPVRYVPIGIDRAMLAAVARGVVDDYSFVHVHGIAGDFLHHLDQVPAPVGPRLVAFFGSAIGSLHAQPRRELLEGIRDLLAPGDRLLLGLDLVKPAVLLELAYNDRRGVTAALNRSVLRVVNHELGADFRPELYRHRATYNAEAARVEMHLVPAARQTVTVRELGLRVELLPFETVWTESSYKFTLESATSMLAEAGLALEAWYTDWRGMFALALAGTP